MKYLQFYEGRKPKKTDQEIDRQEAEDLKLVGDHLAEKFLGGSEYIFDYSSNHDGEDVYFVYYFEFIDSDQIDKNIEPLLTFLNNENYSNQESWKIFGDKDRKSGEGIGDIQSYATVEYRLEVAGFRKLLAKIKKEKAINRFDL